MPVVVDNDVNLMAAGEHAAGAGMDVADLLLLHVADGIGAGLVLDGQVRRGATGRGRGGGFPAAGPGPTGAHDGVGPFEARWSDNAIAERVVALTPGRRPDSPVRELVTLARHRPAAPPRYLDEVLHAWARLIVSCVCVVDPGRVLLSGAAAHSTTRALDRLQALVTAAVPSPTEVRRAVLGDRAVLHGAISYALSAAPRTPTLLPAPLTASHRYTPFLTVGGTHETSILLAGALATVARRRHACGGGDDDALRRAPRRERRS